MSADLKPGTLFAGRYQVVRRIAAGGMGAVYEVVHLETDRRRALKVMLPHVLQNDEMRERFKREAKVAARIESELIVEVFDAGVDDETRMPFLVMELLRGEELGKRLKRVGPLPPFEVVEYLRQTALALDKTHKASIVHRDLKPENLFLTEREDGPPRVKVLDFGIAKIVAESATASGATQSIGTPLYMAPEQFNPHAHLTGAADLYALGMVAFTLLVGHAYWAEETRGGNLFALAAVAIHGPREPASARAARRGVTLPPSFDAWFARMTAVLPEHRFATASEAVRALADALGLSGAPREEMASLALPAAAPAITAPSAQVTAPATSLTHATPPRVAGPSGARAALVAAAGLGTLAMLGGAALYVLRTERPPAPLHTAAPATEPAPPPTSNASATTAPIAPMAPTAEPTTTAAPTAATTPRPSATSPAKPTTPPRKPRPTRD